MKQRPHWRSYLRGDRKRVTHLEDPRRGYVGSRTRKELNKQLKGPDRKKAIREEMKDGLAAKRKP